MSSGADPGHDPAAVTPDHAPSPLDDAVRRELIHLGSDAATAPEVPTEVTARVGAALRDAPHLTGHTVSRPKLTRAQRAGLLLGIGAIAVAVVVGALTVNRDPGPRFPAVPNASQITVAGPQRAFPVPDQQLRAALAAPPDLGPLADPQRRSSCLTGLGHSPTEEILGARPVEVFGRPAILLVFFGPTPEQIAAVVVEASCSQAHTGMLAETVVNRR